MSLVFLFYITLYFKLILHADIFCFEKRLTPLNCLGKQQYLDKPVHPLISQEILLLGYIYFVSS